MRLRNIQQTLNNNVNLLEPNIEDTGANTFIIKNVNLIRQAVENVATTGLFSEKINGIRGSLIYNNIDNIKLSHNNYNQANALLQDLRKSIKDLLESLNVALGNEPVNGSSIKLPPIKSFSDAERVFSLLRNGIDTPLANEVIKGEAKIIAFDSGSFWVDVEYTTIEEAKLIGELVYSSLVVYKQKLENINLEIILNKVEANTLVSGVSEKTEQYLKSIIKKEALNVYLKYINGDTERINPEDLLKLENSIGILATFMGLGGEIYPFLEAPIEVKELYPTDYTDLNRIESRVKQLNENNPKLDKNEDVD